MASFDIKSLFTNNPLDETIKIICNRLYSNCVRYHRLTQLELKTLLELTVKNCHFLFNGVLYQQVDGVAMGSPLSPYLPIFSCPLTKVVGLVIARLALSRYFIAAMLAIVS